MPNWLIHVFMDGTEFKKALNRLGLSQRKFAAETGMSVSAVNEWATDRSSMSQIAVAYIRLRLMVAGLVPSSRSKPE